MPTTLEGGTIAPPDAQTAPGLAGSLAPTQAMSFHVDGSFQVLYTHGSDLDATAEGTLTLGNGTKLNFTTSVEVKHSGNNIRGTPTFVFDDGSTLTFNYAIKLDATGVFSGDWSVTGGTGLFAGASGVGTISYPLSSTGTGPLTMEGAISL